VAPASLDAALRQRQKSGMKISSLLQVAFVSVFVAAPALAASLPAASLSGSSVAIPLCGEDKADKDEKAETTDKKADKKTDKKDSKEKKGDSKGSA
jgi:hypothetical protein